MSSEIRQEGLAHPEMRTSENRGHGYKVFLRHAGVGWRQGVRQEQGFHGSEPLRSFPNICPRIPLPLKGIARAADLEAFRCLPSLRRGSMVVQKSKGVLRFASNPLQSANQGRKAPLSACILPGKTAPSHGEDCRNQRHTAVCWYLERSSRLDVLFVSGTAVVKGSVKGFFVVEIDSCAKIPRNPAGFFGLLSGPLLPLKSLGQEVGNHSAEGFPLFFHEFFQFLKDRVVYVYRRSHDDLMIYIYASDVKNGERLDRHIIRHFVGSHRKTQISGDYDPWKEEGGHIC